VLFPVTERPGRRDLRKMRVGIGNLKVEIANCKFRRWALFARRFSINERFRYLRSNGPSPFAILGPEEALILLFVPGAGKQTALVMLLSEVQI
jgi:hypothetical protein